MNTKQSLKNVSEKGNYIFRKEDSNNHAPVSWPLTLMMVVEQLTGEST